MNTPALPDDNVSPEALSTILDSLDALVYVADMDTYELLYMNAYGRAVWGHPGGRRCWETIQVGQTGPCPFCTNHRLLDAAGAPRPPHVWEFRNTVNQHWYQCRDQAIRWSDGRVVRLEIATDITERKHMEEALERASSLAHELALTDELTGLDNRRAFFDRGSRLMRQLARGGRPVSLVMIDADHFKQINDCHGHKTGDRALVAIGAVLRRHVRDADIFARIGGEEFAVLMADTTADEALRLAERLRGAIATIELDTGDATLRCSASFGVTTGQADEHSLERLLSCADQAMYRAKQRGRDRVELGAL